MTQADVQKNRETLCIISSKKKKKTGYLQIILYLAQRKYKPTGAANTVAEFAPVSLAQGQIKACLLQATTLKMEPAHQPTAVHT